MDSQDRLARYLIWTSGLSYVTTRQVPRRRYTVFIGILLLIATGLFSLLNTIVSGYNLRSVLLGPYKM
jgi:hypothetical protein